MDDNLKKDPLMGDSSELDAEVADFGKDVSDSFDEAKTEADSVASEGVGEVVDMSTPEPEVESVNIEKVVVEEPKEAEPEEEPVSEIGAAMDEMLKAEDEAEAGDVEKEVAEEAKESVEDSEKLEGSTEDAVDKSAENVEKNDEPAEEAKDSEVENNEMAADETADAVAAEVAATEVVAESTQPKPEKKKSKKGLLIGILILLLVAAGVVCAIMLMPKDDKKDKKLTPPTEKEVTNLKLKDNSLSDFDLKFLKIENETKNKIYSPLSIKYALAMLKDGTAGESKKQIEDILGDYAPKKYINSKNLSLANGVFIRDDFKDSVKESYAKDVNEKYAAEVIYDSFKSSANINGWIKNKTLGQIPNMLDDDAVSDKKFFLINSLAIDMNWKNMIQAGSTKTKGIKNMPYYDVYYPHEKYDAEIRPYEYSEGGKFNGEEKVDVAEIGTSVNRYDIIGKLGEENIRKTVMDDYNKEKASGKYDEQYFEYFNIDEYMTELGEGYKKIENSTDFYFYVGDDVKVFAKDLKEYDGITLQYVAVMPTETGLTDYVNNASAETINGLIGNLKDASDINNYKDEVITKVFGYVPMFNYSYNLNLKDDLKEIGVKDVFAAETADLSNITDEKNMYVMDALHSSKIEFSNEGIKAAATTIIGGGKGGGGAYDYVWDVPVEEIDLTFDKPFLYLIRDKATGEVWFTGTVYKGIKK